MFELVTLKRTPILSLSAHATYPTFVGEAPGPNTDPSRPFCGASGIRLAELAGLSGFEELERRAHLRNVLDFWPGAGNRGEKGSRFPVALGRERAAAMSFPYGTSVVIVGARVADAFGIREALPEPFRWARLPIGAKGGAKRVSLPVAWTPHTSGSCRFWNETKNRRVGARFFRSVFPTARDLAAERA